MTKSLLLLLVQLNGDKMLLLLSSSLSSAIRVGRGSFEGVSH